MAFPCIVILRHQSNVYQWTVTYHQETLDGDIGETSITYCLTAALGSLPDEENLVEISYRGIHMGTFDTRHIDDSSGEVAAIIFETYGTLLHNN